MSESIWCVSIAAVALLAAAWVLGRELKIGLAAAGKHIGTAMATGWASPGLIPKDQPAAKPLDMASDEIQGIDTKFLEAAELHELEWVDEVCQKGPNASEQDRIEAFTKLDYYARVVSDRAAGRTPFSEELGAVPVHPSLRAETEPVIR